jgi:hypothetical protein
MMDYLKKFMLGWETTFGGVLKKSTRISSTVVMSRAFESLVKREWPKRKFAEK